MSETERRVVIAGETVNYHGDNGDDALVVLRFNSLGRADLAWGSEVLYGVREGPELGQWSR